MLMSNKIALSDNGTVTDESLELNNFHGSDVSLLTVAAEDAIYVGSHEPFNNRYIQVMTANANASNLSVSVWDNKIFRPVVELNDETSVSGATLGQSGIVSWVPDNQHGWHIDDTADIAELSSITVYRFYWAKFTWDADLSGGSIRYVGHKFSNDQEMASIYPDLLRTEVLDCFETGKTDWDEQHIRATEQIIRDLVNKQVTTSGNEILEWQRFSEAALHRTAMIIFRALGDDFANNFARAENDYRESFEIAARGIDSNRNARVDRSERFPFSTVVRR